MPMTTEEALGATERALVLGVAGDLMAAGQVLAPVIYDSYGAAYALAGMLAGVASHTARREQTGGFFTFTIDNPETGEPASADELPLGIAFAAQFTTAWANHDLDTAEALFMALVRSAGTDGSELTDGLLDLLQLAVFAATAVVKEQRAQRNTTD